MQGSKRSIAPPAVIAGADGSDAAPAVLLYAALEAEIHHLPLRIVHVATLLAGDPVPAQGRSAGDARWLEVVRRQMLDVARVRPRVRRGSTSFALRHGSAIGELVAAATPGSRLVVGADRAEPGRPRGVVAECLAARVECPITVVPRGHGTGGPDGSVVVGYKDRWESTAALRAGFDEAARRGRRLQVLHSYWPRDVAHTESDELFHLDELVVGLQDESPGVQVQVRMAHGAVASTVHELVAPGDLLVLGRSIAWMTHPTLGPVGSELLVDPPCPVLVVPPSYALEPDDLSQPQPHSRGTAR
jgi:hypothetical protein